MCVSRQADEFAYHHSSHNDCEQPHRTQDQTMRTLPLSLMLAAPGLLAQAPEKKAPQTVLDHYLQRSETARKHFEEAEAAEKNGVDSKNKGPKR
jgi:hypothetical protein